MTSMRVLTALVVVLMSIPAVADIDDGLVAHWPLDGNATDISANGNDGALVGGVTFVPDRFGVSDSACSFDGISGYVNIGSGVKPMFPLSVSLWVEVPFTLGQYALFRNDIADNNSYRYGVTLTGYGAGALRAMYFEGFSASWNRVGYISTADSLLVPGDWHHWVTVFAGHMDIQMYWDGQPVPGEYSGTGSGMTYSTADGALGHWDLSPPDGLFFGGCLDDVRVYDRTLSAADVAQLYAGSSPVESVSWTRLKALYR